MSEISDAEKRAIEELGEFAADGFFELCPNPNERNKRHVNRLTKAFEDFAAAERARIVADIHNAADDLELRGDRYTAVAYRNLADAIERRNHARPEPAREGE